MNNLTIPCSAPVEPFLDFLDFLASFLDGSSIISSFNSSPIDNLTNAAATSKVDNSSSAHKDSTQLICFAKLLSLTVSLTCLKNAATFFSSTSAIVGIPCLTNLHLVYLSISLIFLISFPYTKLKDTPSLPARPVLPIL